MAIAYKNKWYAPSSVTLTASAGDFLIASASVISASSDTITPPAGWTLVATRTWSFPGVYVARQSIYQKVATGSEGSQTWSTVSPYAQNTLVSSWTGVDPAVGVEAYASAGDPGDNVGTFVSPSQAFASVTSVSSNAMIVALGWAGENGGSTPSSVWPTVGPSGFTSPAGPDIHMALSYKTQATAGATGSLPVTIDSDVLYWSDWTLVLKPVPAAQTLTPSLFTNTNSLFSPTVSQTGAPQTLAPALLSNTSNFFDPTVTAGAVALAPPLLASSNSFFAASAAPGLVSLAPGLLTNSSTLFAPTLAGHNTLAPPLVANSNDFYSPAVSVGEITLEPPLVSTTNVVHAPTVTLTSGAQTLSPPRLTNVSTLYMPAARPAPYALFAPLLQNPSGIYGPTASPGTVVLAPAPLQNANQFFDASVALLKQVLAADRLDSASIIFPPSVAGGLQLVRPPRVENANVFLVASASNDNPPDTYPLAVPGHAHTRPGRLAGGGSVLAGAVAAGGRVVASALKGRS